MRDYSVVLVGTVHAPGREELELHIDSVMEELLRLEAVDPSVDVNFSRATIHMHVRVGAANPVDATIAASGLFRSAIHAAGGSTPDWPSPGDQTWSVQLTGLETGELIAG